VFSTLAAVDGMVIRAERGGKLVVEDGPIEGPELLRICQQIIRDDASLKDQRAQDKLMRWLRLRARSEVRGDDLSDILRDLGVPRTTFYPRTTALALRVVAYLNAYSHAQPPVAPRCNKANQAS
jgi:hypothetical protein